MIHFKVEQVGEVLQRLYDSGIDITLNGSPGTGFAFLIGSVEGVIKYESRGPKPVQIENAITGIAFAAARDFPKSEFSKWYKNSLESNS